MRRRGAWKASRVFAAACAGLFLVLTGSAGAASVSAPTSLAASPVSSSQINLTWVDTNSNETGYLVERSLSSSSGFVQIASLPQNTQSYASTGLAAGTTYYYQVRAAKNGAFSAYSNVASARTLSSAPTATPTRTPTSSLPTATPTKTPTSSLPTATPTKTPTSSLPTATPTKTPTPPPTTATPTPPPGTIPAAPSNLSASAVSSSAINIAWTDNSNNETAFRMERSLAAAGPWSYLGTTTLTGYGDSGLQPSTAYYYRVAAYNSTGYSAYSNTASATTQGGSSPPAPPSSLSASMVSSSQINLTWADSSTNETGFKIEQSTSVLPWTQIATVGTNVTSYSNTSLLPSTTYSYRVRATNAAGDSAYSNTGSATTSGATGGTGAHVWSTHFGGSGSSNATPVGIEVDSTGASVVLGYFSGSVSFGGVQQTSAGLGDIYLVKFSSSGSLVWVKRFGGTGDDVAKGIAIDASDNIYITGYFRSTVDFGGGPLTTAGTSAFLAKYASTGAHLWSKRLNSLSGIDEGTAVGVDGSGNAIVAVGIYGTSDFGGGPLTTAGGSDIVLVKYSATGAYLWSHQFLGASGDDSALSLAVDRTTGETWATGYFAGSVDFGGGALTSAGGTDIFVIKYSSAGTHVWSRRFGNTSADKGYGIAVDQAGNVVVTGMFTGNVDFGAGTLTNTGGGDIFLVKYSASGVCQWSKNWGSAISIDEVGYAVAFDGSGNVLLTGTIEQPINFGGGTLTGDGWYNAFIAKFDVLGGYSWAKRYVNGAGNSNGKGIAADGAGNALATGNFDVAINLGGVTMTSPGGTDTYLVKLGP